MFNSSQQILITPKVVAADGTVRYYPQQANMITDKGMTALADGSNTLYNIFSSMFIGTDGTPNYRQSATEALSCTISTVTSSSDFFTAADATNKRLIHFSDNVHAYITSYLGPTSVIISKELNFTGLTGRIYNTETEKLVSYLASGVNIATQFGDDYGYTSKLKYRGKDKSTLEFRNWKTFRFDFIDTGATIREVGWSTSSSTTSSLAGRLVLNIPIVTNEAEMLFLTVETRNEVPYGAVTADPIFGTPAFLNSIVYLTNVSATTPNNNNFTTVVGTPYCLPKNTLNLLLFYDNGATTLTLSSTNTSRTTKPYRTINTGIQILNSNILNIVGYGLTYSTDTNLYESKCPTIFKFNDDQTKNITDTQIFQLSCTSTIERTLQPFDGSTPVDDTIDPDFGNYDGSVPCVGEVDAASTWFLGNSYLNSYGFYDPYSLSWYAFSPSNNNFWKWSTPTLEDIPTAIENICAIGASGGTAIADNDYWYVKYNYYLIIIDKITKMQGWFNINQSNSLFYINNIPHIYRETSNLTNSIICSDGATITYGTPSETLPVLINSEKYLFVKSYTDYFVCFTTSHIFGVERSTGKIVWKTKYPFMNLTIDYLVFNDTENKVYFLAGSSSMYRMFSMSLVNWDK